MALLTNDRAAPPGGLTPAQERAYLEGWAARVPIATMTDEAQRNDRRRAMQARLLGELTAAIDPKLKERVAQARRQVLLCEHEIAVCEHEIKVLEHDIPKHLDDKPAHRAKIEQQWRELPLLQARLPELREAQRAAMLAVRAALSPGYNRLLADTRQRLELTEQAAKGLIAEAKGDVRAIEFLSLDLDRWIGE